MAKNGLDLLAFPAHGSQSEAPHDRAHRAIAKIEQRLMHRHG